MKKSLYVFTLLFLSLSLLFVSCKEEEKKPIAPNIYTVTFDSDGGTQINSIEIEEGKIIENITDPTKLHYKFLGWYHEEQLFDLTEKITKSLTLKAKWEFIPFIEYSITGATSIAQDQAVKYTAKYVKDSTKTDIIWTIEDETIIAFTATADDYCRIKGVKPGTTTLTATSKDDSTYKQEVEITVNPKTYEIIYDLSEEDKVLMPNTYPTTYQTNVDSLELPVLSKPNWIFRGWKVLNADGVHTALTPTLDYAYEIRLEPVWSYPFIDIEAEKSVISVNDTLQTVVTPTNVPTDLLTKGYIYSSANEAIATVDENGLITAIGNGYTTITVKVKGQESIMMTYGITVTEDIKTINEVLKYFVDNQIDVIAKQATAIGGNVYSFDLLTSVSRFLFEDLEVIENIAPITNANRPGTIAKKYYVTIHDTGDDIRSAKEWSDIVYNNGIGSSTYGASYQYVLGNDGIYHNIPDNEVSYHAGDGTRNPYQEIKSGVKGTNESPKVTITDDGYYAIDGQKSLVKAPTNNGEILKTSDINDVGIRVVLKNGEYYLGNTYYNKTYRKISNYGGNVNSIGIESCINQGSDIFYTWQKLAKLVAKLLDENDLTIKDVVPHHYFSGKNCPQTMRGAGMWEYFLSMIQVESKMREYMLDGYKISFESYNKDIVNNLGRVIKWPTYSQTVSYKITVSKNDISESIVLSTKIPGRANVAI